MVNFLEPKRLSGIVTEGSGSDKSWVTQYMVYYSTDGARFVPYTDIPGGKHAKVFSGNTDSVTDATQLFSHGIIAQYIRVIPVQTHGGAGGMRFNVLGCNPSPVDEKVPEKTTVPPPMVSGATPTLSPPHGTQVTPSVAPVYTTPSGKCSRHYTSLHYNQEKCLPICYNPELREISTNLLRVKKNFIS